MSEVFRVGDRVLSTHIRHYHGQVGTVIGEGSAPSGLQLWVTVKWDASKSTRTKNGRLVGASCSPKWLKKLTVVDEIARLGTD